MIGLKGVFSGQGPLRIQLFPVIGLNDWTNVPSRDWAHILDPSLWGRQRVPCGPLPPDRPAEHICLSWAFFPFTHSLCRDARQISIIHKQLSYLPQRMNQVCVYWFKINNLHSWRGGTFAGWQRCIWTCRQDRCCCRENRKTNVNVLWRIWRKCCGYILNWRFLLKWTNPDLTFWHPRIKNGKYVSLTGKDSTHFFVLRLNKRTL